MKFKTLFILLLVTFKFQAQSSNDYILTNEQNKKWIENIASQDLASGIALLNKRLLSDTDVYYSSAQNSQKNLNQQKDYKAKTSIRPLYIFLSIDGKSQISLKDNPNKQAIQQLVVVLNAENVLKLNVSNEKKDTAAIFGLRAAGGVLFITLKNNETVNLIKNLQF